MVTRRDLTERRLHCIWGVTEDVTVSGNMMDLGESVFVPVCPTASRVRGNSILASPSASAHKSADQTTDIEDSTASNQRGISCRGVFDSNVDPFDASFDHGSAVDSVKAQTESVSVSEMSFQDIPMDGSQDVSQYPSK